MKRSNGKQISSFLLSQAEAWRGILQHCCFVFLFRIASNLNMMNTEAISYMPGCFSISDMGHRIFNTRTWSFFMHTHMERKGWWLGLYYNYSLLRRTFVDRFMLGALELWSFRTSCCDVCVLGLGAARQGRSRREGDGSHADGAQGNSVAAYSQACRYPRLVCSFIHGPDFCFCFWAHLCCHDLP